MRNFLKDLRTLLLATIVSLGISMAYAWNGPLQTPPNGNPSVPINTSVTTQTKSGGLWAASFLTTGGGYFGGNVGIGTSNPEAPLDVQVGDCSYQFKSNEFYSDCPIIDE